MTFDTQALNYIMLNNKQTNERTNKQALSKLQYENSRPITSESRTFAAANDDAVVFSCFRAIFNDIWKLTAARSDTVQMLNGRTYTNATDTTCGYGSASLSVCADPAEAMRQPDDEPRVASYPSPGYHPSPLNTRHLPSTPSPSSWTFSRLACRRFSPSGGRRACSRINRRGLSWRLYTTTVRWRVRQIGTHRRRRFRWRIDRRMALLYFGSVVDSQPWDRFVLLACEWINSLRVERSLCGLYLTTACYLVAEKSLVGTAAFHRNSGSVVVPVYLIFLHKHFLL